MNLVSSSFGAIMFTLEREVGVRFGGSREDVFKQFCFWCFMVSVSGQVGRLFSVVVYLTWAATGTLSLSDVTLESYSLFHYNILHIY